MNILYYCVSEFADAYPTIKSLKKGEFSGTFIYDWHFYHTVDELKKAGHTVKFLNPVTILGRKGSVAEYAQVLLDEVKSYQQQHGLDLFFATATDSSISSNVIDQIRELGIPTVNFSCDDYADPYRIRNIASHFDLNWSTVRESKSLLQSYGANVLIMPWGSNPSIFKPSVISEEPFIGFIGSNYGARARSIYSIAAADLPIFVYGQKTDTLAGHTAKINNPIPRALKNLPLSLHRIKESLAFPAGRQCLLSALKRSILEIKTNHHHLLDQKITYLPGPSFEEMSKCYNRMALSLGSMELRSTYVLKKPLIFIRLREFEVPMCGGIHLTNRFPELLEYFEEDKEMLFYSSQEELIDKTRYYLSPKRETIRRNIRLHARQRAEAEHTWICRFQRIGEKLNLSF